MSLVNYVKFRNIKGNFFSQKFCPNLKKYHVKCYAYPYKIKGLFRYRLLLKTKNKKQKTL